MLVPACGKSAHLSPALLSPETDSDKQKHSTRGSRVIPQHSTNLAQTRLTSEIGRDRVLSGWYDRAMRELWYGPYIYTMSRTTPGAALCCLLDVLPGPAVCLRLSAQWLAMVWTSMESAFDIDVAVKR